MVWVVVFYGLRLWLSSISMVLRNGFTLWFLPMVFWDKPFKETIERNHSQKPSSHQFLWFYWMVLLYGSWTNGFHEWFCSMVFFNGLSQNTIGVNHRGKPFIFSMVFFSSFQWFFFIRAIKMASNWYGNGRSVGDLAYYRCYISLIIAI